MTIEFNCPQCAQQIRTPDTTAGKRGKCPSCAAIVRIPAPADAAAKSAPPQPAAEVVETGPIEFFCSLCGHLVRTPRAAAGKKGKCPHCQGVLQIPLKSRATKASPQPAVPPTKPADDIGLAPLDGLDGLAPLPEAKPEKTKPGPKLQSKPAARAKTPKAEGDDDRELRLQSNVPLAPLTPLDGSTGNEMSGLTPLNSDLFGGGDPLASANAGLAGGDLFSGASLGGDPFAASSSGFGSASTSLAPATYSSPSSVPASVPGKPDSIFLILPAIFQLLAILPFFLWNAFVFASTVFLIIVAMAAADNARAAGSGNPEAAARGVGFVALILALQVLGLGAQIWVIVGSVQMMMLRNYDNAIASAWISCIPCFGLCGMPFGIWSLIVLQTPQYKRMFRD
jgi:hypothetical protein